LSFSTDALFFAFVRSCCTSNNNISPPGPLRGRRRHHHQYCLLFLGLVLLVAVTVAYIPLFFLLLLHHGTTSEGAPQQQSLASFLLYNPTKRKRQRRQRQRQAFQRLSDGTFNGVPLKLRTSFNKNHPSPGSSIHCVGENFHENTAWQQRSCHFTFLCFNTTTHDYVVFQSPQEQEMDQHLFSSLSAAQGSSASGHHTLLHMSTMLEQQQQHSSSSSSSNNKTTTTTTTTTSQSSPSSPSLSVSIGGINLRWAGRHHDIDRLEWFPKVIHVHRNDDNMPAAFSYYELPPHVVLVPFHSMSGSNPGHLM
jgi:hypothetical protein